MKGYFLLISALLFFIINSAGAQSDTILCRYRQYLLKSVEREVNVMQLTTSLNSKHEWPDINYNDTETANWQPLNHLKRIRDLALVWSDSNSSFYQRESVWKAIDGALDHWLERRFQNSNWWHNEIGVPQYMRDIIVLLKGKLSARQLSGAMEVLAQLRLQNNGVGANLTWSADLGFHYGALTNNIELMKECRKLILNEIKITTGDGVQPDFSFHQHGDRLQIYQYGRAFLWDNVRLAWEFRGTSLAFPQEKIKLLSDFILMGWQWMARGIRTVPGTMDRAVSRVGALESADIRKLIPYITELDPQHKAVFKALAGRQNGNGSLAGYRYFPYSDFTAYHQKNFSFFVKTISSHILPSESINGENLKGQLLGAGDSYLVRDGSEYFNLMPVWNWEHLPGVTSFKGADNIGRNPFSASVSNGEQGFTAMKYELEDQEKKKHISVHKFWACHGNVIVCLASNLQLQNIDSGIYTTLDQCRWKGNVSVNKVTNITRDGIHNFDKVKWIYHAGFAYILLKPGAMNLSLKTFTGTWKSINNSLSDSLIKEKVFMPVMCLKKKSTGYVIASCANAAQANLLAEKPSWIILRNDKYCQAVLFDDGTVMAAFYGSELLTSSKWSQKLEVNKPCLILITANKIYVSNPVRNEKNLLLKFNNKSFRIKLDDHGYSTEIF